MDLSTDDVDYIKFGAPTLEEWLDKCYILWDGHFGWVDSYETTNGRIVYRFKVGRSARNIRLLGLMRENTLMWGVGWYSSNRKGIHKFKLKAVKQAANVVQFPKVVGPGGTLVYPEKYEKVLDTAAVM